MASPALSIVVPVYCEEQSLAALDAEIRAALRELGRPAEILYVDDGSTDGSWAVLTELFRRGAGDPIRTRLVRLRRNFGQTAALAAGFDLAAGEIVVPIDADGQNDPRDVARLLAKLEEGYDVVSGWRRIRKDRQLTRKLPSRVANRWIAALAGLDLHDYGCTLKAYRASLLREVRLYGNMHRFLPAYLFRLGARVAEVEVNHRARIAGKSKYGTRRVFSVLLDLVLMRFMLGHYARPMQFFGYMSLVLMAGVALALAAMVVFKFGWLRLVGISYRASFIQTPLPALAGTLFVGAVSSLFFGILGEILIRVHHETQGLKPYVVHDVVGADESPD